VAHAPVTVVLHVANNGAGSASGVTAALHFTEGAVPIFGPVPSVPQTVTAGSGLGFTWTFTPTGGTVAFTAVASGTDVATGQTISGSDAKSLTVQMLAADKVEKGKMLVAPNILDPSDPAAKIVFAARGNPGAELVIEIYTETGVKVGVLHGRLDGTGLGTVELTRPYVEGQALSTGAYFARVSGGGVSDIKSFAVRRKK
jgi:hypothetical protein